MRLLLVILLCATARPATSAAHGNTLILEFTPEALDAAVAAASATVTAAADVTANEAYMAAVQRDAPADRATAAAAMAREAAILEPVLAGISSEVAAQAASSAGVDIVQRYVYTTVLNGVSISVSSLADMHRLKAQLQESELVKSVYIAGSHRIPKLPDEADRAAATATAAAAGPTATSSATKGSANATGIASLPNYSSSTNGQGVLICVIDTGVNYKTALFGCTQVSKPAGSCKMVTGYDFVGDDYTGSPRGPAAAPDKEPVASIAATSFGVAPGAQLGAYRVFGCEGEATDDVIIAAMDRAVRDGCDIINLSLASASGYPDSGVYDAAMTRTTQRGVLVTRAAGNSGGDGPFMADASTAVGAVALGAAGTCQSDLDDKLVMAGFSSYGPSPDLATQLPHVAAPGACVPVVNKLGMTGENSGTSFSSPFVAGSLALWLQQKKRDAASSGSALRPSSVSQAAAIRALVTTATPIPDVANNKFLAPVAQAGSGLIRVDALLANRVLADPVYLPLPSGLTSSYTTTITYTWEGPGHAAGTVPFIVKHSPAVALTLADSWYREIAPHKVYSAVQVSVSPTRLLINTRTKKPVTLQVTFTLPAAMTKRGLLYSGLIRLVPALAKQKLAAVSVPYQGYSKAWSSLPLLARPLDSHDFYHSTQLREQANALCYTPFSMTSLDGAILDSDSGIPTVCDSFAATNSDAVQASLSMLQKNPSCSLRISSAPQVPVRSLLIDLLDAAGGQQVGSLPTIDTSACNSLQTPESVGSFCLGFDGSYTDMNGARQRVTVGSSYRLRATVVGPVALSPDEPEAQAPRATVAIRGILEIVE